MAKRRQPIRHRVSKNTTECVLIERTKKSEASEKWGVPSPSPCASLPATRTSSRALRIAVVGPLPLKAPRRPTPRRKASYALTTTQARLLSKGALHAIRIGLPLNRFITIDWELAGVSDSQKALAAFLKLLRDWLERAGHSTAYLWVQECGEVIGIHSHILVHVPPALIKRLGQLQRGWLKRIGVVSRKGVVRSKPIGYTSDAPLAADDVTQASYRQNLEVLIDYVLKAADRKARNTLGLGRNRLPKYSLVTGKRAGTSRNIGIKARQLWFAGPVSETCEFLERSLMVDQADIGG